MVLAALVVAVIATNLQWMTGYSLDSHRIAEHFSAQAFKMLKKSRFDLAIEN